MLFTLNLRLSKPVFESLTVLDLRLLVFDHFCLLAVTQLFSGDFSICLVLQSSSVHVALIVLFYRLKNWLCLGFPYVFRDVLPSELGSVLPASLTLQFRKLVYCINRLVYLLPVVSRVFIGYSLLIFFGCDLIKVKLSHSHFLPVLLPLKFLIFKLFVQGVLKYELVPHCELVWDRVRMIPPLQSSLEHHILVRQVVHRLWFLFRLSSSLGRTSLQRIAFGLWMVDRPADLVKVFIDRSNEWLVGATWRLL